MKYVFAVGGLLALAACGGTASNTPPVSPADVAALEVGVTIADKLALNYTMLPSCRGGDQVCSDPAVKQAIKLRAQEAHDAVKSLRSSSAADAPAALMAAQAALAALRASIPATTNSN